MAYFSPGCDFRRACFGDGTSVLLLFRPEAKDERAIGAAEAEGVR
jgi:hypothetical protein